MNDRSRLRLHGAGGLALIAAAATWAFWPLDDIVVSSPPSPAVAAPNASDPGPAFPLEPFRTAVLWPPRLRKMPDTKPAPPPTDERRFQDLSLLGIVATEAGHRALLYSKQDDRTIEVGSGDALGPFHVDAVHPASVEVARGDDRTT